MSKDKKKKGERAEAGKDAKIVRLEEQLAEEKRQTAAIEEKYKLEDAAKQAKIDALEDLRTKAATAYIESEGEVIKLKEENARLKAAVQNLTVQPAVTEPAPIAPEVPLGSFGHDDNLLP
jgi:hypothetical protein